MGSTRFYGFDEGTIASNPPPRSQRCQQSWHHGWRFSARASPHRSGTTSWCLSAAPSWHLASAPCPGCCGSWDWPINPGFGRYHEVLNRARWDARDLHCHHLDHPGFASLEINRAVDVQAVATAGLFDRDWRVLWCSAPHRTYRMRRVRLGVSLAPAKQAETKDRVCKQHCFTIAHMIQKVALNRFAVIL
jgi:hypothetical protein